MTGMHCSICGTSLGPEASICPTCGVRTAGGVRADQGSPAPVAATPPAESSDIPASPEVDVARVAAGVLAVAGGFLQMVMLLLPYLRDGERLFSDRGLVVLNVMTGGWVLAAGLLALVPDRTGRLARAALASLIAPAAGQVLGVLIGSWDMRTQVGPGLFFDFLSALVQLAAIVAAAVWLLRRETPPEPARGTCAVLAAVGSAATFAGALMDWTRITTSPFAPGQGCCSPFTQGTDPAYKAEVLLAALVASACILAVAFTKTRWSALGFAAGGVTAALIPVVTHLVEMSDVPGALDLSPAAGFYVVLFGAGCAVMSVVFRFAADTGPGGARSRHRRTGEPAGPPAFEGEGEGGRAVPRSGSWP